MEDFLSFCIQDSPRSFQCILDFFRLNRFLFCFCLSLKINVKSYACRPIIDRLSSLTSFRVFGFNFFHYSFCNLFFHRVTITPTHLYPHLHYRFHYFSTITPMIAVHIILDGYVRDYKTSTHNLVVEGSDNEVLSCIGTFIDCTYRLLHTYLTYRI